MTSTVLRVKRRLEENPQNALVLYCKRRKTDSVEISPSLFVFRGSVENDEETHVKSFAPCSTKLKQACDLNNIIDKIRQKKKESSLENRYKIVNCSRGLKEEDSANENLFDLVDIIKKEDEQENVKFMYDLYISAKEDFDVDMLDDLVGIENYEMDLIFGSYRDNGLLPSDDEDDDDSNAENDYRNEYPDSEASSIDEEDMLRAVEKCQIESDLSSDAGEDKIYDEPADLFNEDVKRYGVAYAKYKAGVLRELPDLSDSSQFVHCEEIKEIESDGYKDDSDDGFYYGQEEDSEHFQEQYRCDSSNSYEPD